MTGAVGDMGLCAEPGSSPAGDPAAPIILGGTPCPRCEAAVRDGLESCPGCRAAIPMDATEWMPWGAAEPWIKMTRREKILLLPPLGIIAAGGVLLGLLMAGSTLGFLPAEAELLGWLATFLMLGGIALLIAGLAGLGILWLLERVGTAVGLLDEEAPADLVPTGPWWHVVRRADDRARAITARAEARARREAADGAPDRFWDGTRWVDSAGATDGRSGRGR